MRTVVLPSGEIVDIDVLLDALIDNNLGVKGIESIVVFGSATQELVPAIHETKHKFLWLIPYTRTHETYTRPNDIDILVIYNKIPPAIEAEEYEIDHRAEYKARFSDGYGYFLKVGFKKSKLHIIVTSLDRLEEAMSQKDQQYLRVKENGIVIYGENPLFPESARPTSMLNDYQYDLVQRVWWENDEPY